MKVYIIQSLQTEYNDEYYSTNGYAATTDTVYKRREKAEEQAARLEAQTRVNFKPYEFYGGDLGIELEDDDDFYKLTWADVPDFRFYKVVELEVI